MDSSDDACLKRSRFPTARTSPSQRCDDHRPPFHVFLAHSNRDKPSVERIAAQLRERGLNPWLDQEQVRPGAWFQDAIQIAIKSIRSAAIVIGQCGVARWQAMELRAFISRCVEAQIPVIPVLLPDVSMLPEDLVFLREFRYVQFKSLTDEPAYELLVWSITGDRPDSHSAAFVDGNGEGLAGLAPVTRFLRWAGERRSLLFLVLLSALVAWGEVQYRAYEFKRLLINSERRVTRIEDDNAKRIRAIIEEDREKRAELQRQLESLAGASIPSQNAGKRRRAPKTLSGVVWRDAKFCAVGEIEANLVSVPTRVVPA